MKSWDVQQISSKEYHVMEKRYVSEPEYILARCSGPVPAWEIVHAMRIAQSLSLNYNTIHNAVFGIDSALKRFDYDIRQIKEASQDNGSGQNGPGDGALTNTGIMPA